MKTINLNTLENIEKLIMFSDNQPHIRLNTENIKEGEAVNVICSITDSSKLLQLLMVANAMDKMRVIKNKLYIPYLMGARYDRVMVAGDSFDLEIIADLVNQLGFINVILTDVHSEMSTRLIKSSKNTIPNLLVDYKKERPLFICPDKGGVKRVPIDVDVIYCDKERNPENGFITLKVNDAEKVLNRNCVILDDICDGGRTFIEIAKQVNLFHPLSLTLAVTHGIFSNGLKELSQHFDQIITTNSLPIDGELILNRKLQVIDILKEIN